MRIPKGRIKSPPFCFLASILNTLPRNPEESSHIGKGPADEGSEMVVLLRSDRIRLRLRHRP